MVAQLKSIVFTGKQCPGRQRVTWKVMSKSPLQPPTPSTSLDSCLPTGLALFLPLSPTPTTPFLGSADLVLEVFSIKVSSATIWLLRPWSGTTCPRSKPVLDCEVVEASILDAQTEKTIWLLVEQDRSTGGRIGQSDEPVGHISLNISLQSLQFHWP